MFLDEMAAVHSPIIKAKAKATIYSKNVKTEQISMTKSKRGRMSPIVLKDLGIIIVKLK